LSDSTACWEPLIFNSLEAFRPQVERAAELQVAEAQRREFFHQLHRWLRQGFREIWTEYGFEAHEPKLKPEVEIGSLARGFICDTAKIVVVTDAEIFG